MNDNDDLEYLKTLTILYAEDDDSIRGQLAQFLKRRCHQLYSGSNGKEGLDLFEKHRSDIVVTDILMPEMDGLKMGEAIRLINPKTPIIITTAFEEPRYFHRAIDLGVDKYVTKPVDLAILESALLKCARTIRAEVALRELQERTTELLEAQRMAKLGHWRLDLVGGKLSWSDEFLRIFEIEAARFGSCYAAFLNRVHPDDRDWIDEAYQAHLKEHADYDVEHRLLLNDGKIKYVHERRQTERDAEDKPIRTLGTVQDITERKLIELELEQHRQHLEELVLVRTQQLEKSKNEAESANRAKSVFLSNMSHELRTPLNAILGFAQLIERDHNVSEAHRKELQTINRAGQHLLALINDVLEISRIEAGHSSSQCEAFDFNDLLIAIEDMIRNRADEKQLHFELQRVGQLPHFVKGDSHHLHQVLLNLLGNAVKYTDVGSITFNVTPFEDSICFEVTDTGVGISAEDLTHIFHPFYQTESGIAKGEGTGLGLTISKEFVRLMGGEITVKSNVNQGSTFAFTIPLPEVDSLAVVQKTHGHVLQLAKEQQPIRVLVVEDNEDNRLLLSRILENVGFNVLCVENGKEAISAFELWQPHFIWMDMRMPVMNGYDASKAIRALPNGKEVKIAALTASAFQEDRDAILTAGCDDMLTKPLEEDCVFEVMKKLLSLKYNYEDKPEQEARSNATLDFNVLDKDMRLALQQAAELLDVEAVQSLVVQIKESHPKQAKLLEQWLSEFCFEKIQQAVNY